MASLSLPRVLQLKKGLDAEREHFEKFQTLAVQKAINAIETPVKEKHVRSAIIGTFQEQSASTYWMVAIHQPLQDNRIVAWKFCHVTHKLLREGHPACLDDSQRHIGMIENLGKLWVHLREGYGKLVHLYCNLLVCKLKFHARNPRFPGSMQLTAEELDNIAENDVNNYFQLCVELFDYMDDILHLQAAVFDSLGNARANSMTASGQCRLAALIPCAQDSSHIYDCNVRLLFRLHASLPADTLAGHRERFRVQFKKLSSFYKHASSLQYYRNLLTLPVLPSNPPNFLLQSDFGTYVAPVVSIPEPAPDEVDAVASLIDTSDTISQATTPEQLDVMETRATPSPQPDPIVERDRLIDHLQNELRRMRTEVSQLVQERNTMLHSMREHCTRLETQLQTTKHELEEEKQKAEQLAVQTPEIKQKLTETEEKAKITDEKFQKLKGAYTQLREEHITLIRQKAEVDKVTASLRAAAAQHESAKMALQQQLNDKMKDVELLQQSASSTEEIDMYKNEIANLRTDLEQSRQKEAELEILRASLQALEIEHKTTAAEYEEKVTTIENKLSETTENFEKVKKVKEESEIELSKVKEQLIVLRDNRSDEYKKIVEEKEAALKQVAELTQLHQQEKQEQTHYTNKLHSDLENLQQKLAETEIQFVSKCEKMKEEIISKHTEFNGKLIQKDCEIKEVLDKLIVLQNDYDNEKSNYNNKLQEKSSEISDLQKKISDLVVSKESCETLIQDLKTAVNNTQSKLEKVTNEKSKLMEELSGKIKEVNELQTKIQVLIDSEVDINKALLLMENNKAQEISQLTEQLNTVCGEKDREICALQKILEEKNNILDRQKLETEAMHKTIEQLENDVKCKTEEIDGLTAKVKETVLLLDKATNDFEIQQKNNETQILILQDKLLNTGNAKDEIIGNLKNMINEKEDKVISLNIEVNSLSTELSKLKEKLEETQAELEIGNNEILSLREEHETIIEKNERNIALKNQELRNLHEEINKLTQEKTLLLSETQRLTLDNQVHENNIRELEEARDALSVKFKNVLSEQDTISSTLNAELDTLKEEYNKLKYEKENELKLLLSEMETKEIDFNAQILSKNEYITEEESIIEDLKNKIDELQSSKSKEKEEFDVNLAKKEKDMEIMETRLQHTESQKLTVECELQDLLQHNTVLEADLAAVKIKLDEAQKEIAKQRLRIVSCTGDAALQVTNEAIAALDRANVHDSNRAASEMAAKVFEDLARHTDIKGNEESVARYAILAAHSTAQLSAYVSEVSNISTDLELSDKLNNECRTMLDVTKQCLESLKEGDIRSVSCTEARGHVMSVAQAAAKADRLNTGGRSVDDELADMDQAIEQAASQIEKMLEASRAGDSGVKLEVNGKILDACTTLMGAVKVLVQDARKLQNELGDHKTRQKMYRRNPQWSEGLISAAKSVVFAAKLLVSSADEAVGAATRVEGVSAAAHEVAGSTAQLVAASRARAAPASPALAGLTRASRHVAAATGALVAAVRAASALRHDQEALDTSALTLTATRRLEMESKVRSLELESALEAERARLAALRKRHYHLAQLEENGNLTNGKE